MNHSQYWSESRRREIIFNKLNGERDRLNILEAVKNTKIEEKDLNFLIKDIPHKNFKDIEKTTYNTEPFRLELGEFDKWKDNQVLEIGCGLGLDGMQFAKNGAIYTGIDISPDEIEMAKRYFSLENVGGKFINAPIEKCDFSDNSFDLVYSYGVLHHIPQIDKTVEEIYRILKPNGKIIIMVYFKGVNYYLRVSLWQRLLTFFTYPEFIYKFLIDKLPVITQQWLIEHHRNIKKLGIKYLFSQNFINSSTDRYSAPKSDFYSKNEAKKLFNKFINFKMYKRHLPLYLINWLKWMPYSIERLLSIWLGGFLYLKAYKPDK